MAQRCLSLVSTIIQLFSVKAPLYSREYGEVIAVEEGQFTFSPFPFAALMSKQKYVWPGHEPTTSPFSHMSTTPPGNKTLLNLLLWLTITKKIPVFYKRAFKCRSTGKLCNYQVHRSSMVYVKCVCPSFTWNGGLVLGSSQIMVTKLLTSKVVKNNHFTSFTIVESKSLIHLVEWQMEYLAGILEVLRYNVSRI